jgi:hypothetical protein
VPLRELTPDAIARLQAELLRAGLGHEATRKTVHVVLKGMLTHAAQSGLILANPARAVRMARAPMRDEVRPLAPKPSSRCAHSCSTDPNDASRPARTGCLDPH